MLMLAPSVNVIPRLKKQEKSPTKVRSVFQGNRGEPGELISSGTSWGSSSVGKLMKSRKN